MFHVKLLLDVQNSYEPGNEKIFFTFIPKAAIVRENRLVKHV